MKNPFILAAAAMAMIRETLRDAKGMVGGLPPRTRSRTPGKANPAGWKLGRKVAKRTLTKRWG